MRNLTTTDLTHRSPLVVGLGAATALVLLGGVATAASGAASGSSSGRKTITSGSTDASSAAPSTAATSAAAPTSAAASTSAAAAKSKVDAATDAASLRSLIQPPNSSWKATTALKASVISDGEAELAKAAKVSLGAVAAYQNSNQALCIVFLVRTKATLTGSELSTGLTGGSDITSAPATGAESASGVSVADSDGLITGGGAVQSGDVLVQVLQIGDASDSVTAASALALARQELSLVKG